jgi:hypothetical protein
LFLPCFPSCFVLFSLCNCSSFLPSRRLFLLNSLLSLPSVSFYLPLFFSPFTSSVLQLFVYFYFFFFLPPPPPSCCYTFICILFCGFFLFLYVFVILLSPDEIVPTNRQEMHRPVRVCVVSTYVTFGQWPVTEHVSLPVVDVACVLGTRQVDLSLRAAVQRGEWLCVVNVGTLNSACTRQNFC